MSSQQEPYFPKFTSIADIARKREISKEQVRPFVNTISSSPFTRQKAKEDQSISMRKHLTNLNTRDLTPTKPPVKTFPTIFENQTQTSQDGSP